MTRKDKITNVKLQHGKSTLTDVEHGPKFNNSNDGRGDQFQHWCKSQPKPDFSNLMGQKSIPDAPPELSVVWLPGDLENPQNWSKICKFSISILCYMMAFTVAFAAAASSMVYPGIAHEFGVSVESSRLVTTMFLCGYTLGPLVWAPLSELIGRRPVLITTFSAYTFSQIGASLKTKFSILLVSRFLAGFFAGSSLPNCGGILCDIWNPLHRAKALSFHMSMAFLGPSIGPVFATAVEESRFGYRWVFRGIMLLSAATCFAVFFLPETYTPVLLVKKAKKLRVTTGNSGFYDSHQKTDWSPKGILRRTLFRPLEMMMTEPILLLSVIYFSTIYGLLFGLFEVFPIVWTELRGFSPQQTSYLCLGIGLGSSLATGIQLYLLRPLLKLTPKWHGHPPCEMNLSGAVVAGPFLVGGIFWLGWTGAYPSIPWWVPALSTILLGMSFNLIFISIHCYLVDVYCAHAASALAASAMCRSVIGAVVPLFMHQMYKSLGTQWASTIIGCFALFISPSSFLFYKYGRRMRTSSKFAQNLDLKMKERVEAEEQKQERNVENSRE